VPGGGGGGGVHGSRGSLLVEQGEGLQVVNKLKLVGELGLSRG
jgi:hypothetical protein